MNNSNLLDAATSVCSARDGGQEELKTFHRRAPITSTFSQTTDSPQKGAASSCIRPLGLGHAARDGVATPQHISHSTAAPAVEAPADSGSGTVLFEGILSVSTHLNQREDAARSLGLCVRTSRSGPSGGTSRSVLVRLTDPHDPFLLFQLELPEDDYGALKQKLELLVDFNGFPGYLVSMLESIARGGESALRATFAVQPQNAGVGVFRVIETNAFKTVEHISLTLVREADAGQKRYLAERFLHFQQAYHRNREEHAEEISQADAMIDELRADNSSLRETVRQLREELKLTTSESEKSSLERLREREEAHGKECEALRMRCETTLKAEQQKASELQRQLLEDVRTKGAALDQLRAKVAQMESTEVKLQSKLRMAEDKTRLQDDELAQLRDAVEDLSRYKAETSAAMKENEVNYVSITERLRGALSALKAREEELLCLREDNQKQDRYIRNLSAQNERLMHQTEAGDGNLAKAHHIIANQLQAIKSAKERHTIAADQIRSLQALLNERELSLQRLKDELAAATERLQSVQRKNSELREQLQQTDDAREKLSQELKNSQSALLHLQRSTSVNGRHWGVFSSAGAGISGVLGTSAYCVGSGAGVGGVGPAYDAAATRRGGFPSNRPRDVHVAHQEKVGVSPPFEEEARTQSAAAARSPSPSGAVCADSEARQKLSSHARSSGGLTATTAAVANSMRRESNSMGSVNEPESFASKSFFPNAAGAVTSVKASAYF